MNLEQFVGDGQATWTELAKIADDLESSGRTLTAERVLHTSDLYRRAVADLAYARRRFPAEPVLANLEALVSRVRPILFVAGSGARPRHDGDGPPTARSWRGDATDCLLDRLPEMGMALLLVSVGVGLGIWWGSVDPAGATRFLPDALREPDLLRSALPSLAVGAVVVAVLIAAGGVAAAIPTVGLLVVVGVLGGAGLSVTGGGGTRSDLIAAGGVLLGPLATLVTVSGGVGLRLARDLTSPRGGAPAPEVAVPGGAAAMTNALLAWSTVLPTLVLIAGPLWYFTDRVAAAAPAIAVGLVTVVCGVGGVVVRRGGSDLKGSASHREAVTPSR